MELQTFIAAFDLKDETKYPIYLVCCALGFLNQAILIPYVVQRIRNPDSAKWIFRALLPMIVAATDLVMLQAGYGMNVIFFTVIALFADWLIYGPSK